MTMTPKVCDNCHVHQVMHEGHPTNLCCGCNVLTGGAPADWHPVCMATYRGERIPLNEHAFAVIGIPWNPRATSTEPPA